MMGNFKSKGSLFGGIASRKAFDCSEVDLIPDVESFTNVMNIELK